MKKNAVLVVGGAIAIVGFAWLVKKQGQCPEGQVKNDAGVCVSSGSSLIGNRYQFTRDVPIELTTGGERYDRVGAIGLTRFEDYDRVGAVGMARYDPARFDPRLGF